MVKKRYNFKEEADRATSELKNGINRLKPIPDKELMKLLPIRTDQEQLKELIKAVNAETDEMKKSAVLTERLGIVAVNVKNIVEKIIEGSLKFA